MPRRVFDLRQQSHDHCVCVCVWRRVSASNSSIDLRRRKKNWYLFVLGQFRFRHLSGQFAKAPARTRNHPIIYGRFGAEAHAPNADRKYHSDVIACRNDLRPDSTTLAHRHVSSISTTGDCNWPIGVLQSEVPSIGRADTLLSYQPGATIEMLLGDHLPSNCALLFVSGCFAHGSLAARRDVRRELPQTE